MLPDMSTARRAATVNRTNRAVLLAQLSRAQDALRDASGKGDQAGVNAACAEMSRIDERLRVIAWAEYTERLLAA